MRHVLVFLFLVGLVACAPGRPAPVVQLHEFDTITLITNGDVIEVTETGRWLHLQLSPSSERTVERLRQLDGEIAITLLVAGHAAGSLNVRDMLNDDKIRLPRYDWAGDSLAPALNRLRAVTASEARVLVEIGVASPVASFTEAQILEASPDEGRATFKLNTAVHTNDEPLLTAGGLVLARGGSLTVGGDTLHATRVRRDVLEQWLETE